MKIMKNKFLKIAALVLMLCIATTCVIGTSFAKYVTGAEGEDYARVAKWGVKIDIDGDDMFHNTYAADDTALAGKLSVHSNSIDQVFAHCTSGSTTFTITGNPEVAANVSIEFDYASDIVLPAGSVENQTDDYYPVVFTLKQTKGFDGNAMDVTVASGNLQNIKAAINGFSQNYDAEALDLDAEFVLSWEWAYESTDNVNDAKDTLLGDIIVDPTAATVAGTSTRLEYELSITVTQLD